MARRVAKTNEGSAATRFLHDGGQVVEERDAGGGVLRQYVWGQYVDELVQQREYQYARRAQPDTARPFVDLCPLSDLLHRAVALTDDRICLNATVDPFHPHLVEAYDTDVYGRTKVSVGKGRSERGHH